jgi:hypothetical protein
MFNDIPTTIKEKLTASIQSRIAKFLSLKKDLLRVASNSPDLTLRDQANSLLISQSSLESELSDTLKLLEKVETDSYSLSDILAASAFYARMEFHIKSSEAVIGQYKKIAPAEGTIFGIPTKYLLYGS